MYTNTDFLRNRIKLKIRLSSKSIDEEIGIIGITEVKSNNFKFSVEIPKINIEHFYLISNNIEGSGVALYIKKHVEFLVKLCEDVWAVI